MPSTSASTVAWPGRVSSHSFPRSMWTTWTSCTTPCHPMRLSTPHCVPSTCLGRGKEDYAEHHWLRVHESFALLHDLLMHYNNCNVVSFLTALQRQYQTYKVSKLDMLKVGPSLPTTGLCFSMQGSK